MSKCLCCGTELKADVCSYCGLPQLEALDERGLKNVETAIQEYKESLISKITDIRLKVYEYDETTMAYKGTSKIKIADGKNCFGKYVACAETFQGVDDAAIIAKERTITLLYKFEGKEKQTSCLIRLPKCKDKWSFEAKLCENLTLSIRTGTKSIYSEKDNILLELS